MNFHIFTGNHGPHSQETLRDILDPLRYTLRALGHKILDGSAHMFYGDAFNIVVEYFDQNVLRMLDGLPGTVEWGLIATEWFDGAGFNKQVSHDWRSRFLLCQKAIEMPTCKAVWPLTPETAEWAKNLPHGKPAAYFDLGWVPEMQVQMGGEKTHDFGFVGTLTEKREALLNKIAEIGSIQICNGGKAERDWKLSRCRWSLGMRPDLPLPYPSATRGPVSLWAGTPLILEDVERRTATYSAIEGIPYNWGGWEFECHKAVQYPGLRNFEEAYERQIAGFKTSPMKPKVERLLDLTMPKFP